ncbi:MAG TPA: hypothetical protein PKY56_14240 [Candidatus Kapabacteria bacterium]|nr:hypothetical protein [Candidatus Kapabacteria bacterium]HPO61595.1 hypothetical protein [Candidatus Kapabacteria bacterium]
MIAIKEQIKNNLEFLNEQQLSELADYTSFLKIRSKIQKSVQNYLAYSKFFDEDILLSEVGMDSYNQDLLKEDVL